MSLAGDMDLLPVKDAKDGKYARVTAHLQGRFPRFLLTMETGLWLAEPHDAFRARRKLLIRH